MTGQRTINCFDNNHLPTSTSYFLTLNPMMTPAPTVINPRDGEKAVRGAHWMDGSGKSFKNPWPSFQDRVSVDSSRAYLYKDAHVAVILVIGVGEYPTWLS
jgi:hypothetical protein